ncbi:MULTISPECIES: hypothetical protein [unclassified Nocardioides]|uniref:hypothetical protein n=1 Tax=unclassified Nocardioides TaxID=2615069 RepID=UPI003014A846
MLDFALLCSATKVVVIRGSGYNPKKRRENDLLAVETHPTAIDQLGALLCDVMISEGEPVYWMEMPVVSFAFVIGNDVIAEVGLICDGSYVRRDDVGDLELRSPLALFEWLTARGVAWRGHKT